MSSVLTRPLSLLPKGTSFSRLILALGQGDSMRAKLIASDWRDTPEVLATLESLRTKTAVPAGSVTDASWAGPLALHGVGGEALTIQRGLSIVGALEGKMRNVPLRVSVARETGAGITGGWVAAGAAIPVQKTAFDAVVQEHFTFGVIVPLSRELLKLSNSSAEATIRTAVLGGLAASRPIPAAVGGRGGQHKSCKHYEWQH